MEVSIKGVFKNSDVLRSELGRAAGEQGQGQEDGWEVLSVMHDDAQAAALVSCYGLCNERAL